MSERNSAVWHELGVSELLRRQDEEEDGLWDTSPATRPKFSLKSGSSVYGQHLRKGRRRVPLGAAVRQT
eukprot:scaffold104789_cov40-Prasinocladus_malaysianus.AAC.3